MTAPVEIPPRSIWQARPKRNGAHDNIRVIVQRCNGHTVFCQWMLRKRKGPAFGWTVPVEAFLRRYERIS